jgi:hypothetical protein
LIAENDQILLVKILDFNIKKMVSFEFFGQDLQAIHELIWDFKLFFDFQGCENDLQICVGQIERQLNMRILNLINNHFLIYGESYFLTNLIKYFHFQIELLGYYSIIVTPTFFKNLTTTTTTITTR